MFKISVTGVKSDGYADRRKWEPEELEWFANWSEEHRNASWTTAEKAYALRFPNLESRTASAISSMATRLHNKAQAQVQIQNDLRKNEDEETDFEKYIVPYAE